MLKPIVIILCCFCSFYTFSQNYLMDQGQNGFHLTAGSAWADGARTYGVAPGYSWNGRLTAGFALNYETFNNSDITGASIIPQIGYLIFKQGQNSSPLNVQLSAAH